MMATKEELYVSIDKRTYIKNKSNLLRCQEDILNIMKHLHNLKVLSRLKNELKQTLSKLSASVDSNIDSIQDRMPTCSVPKSIKQHTQVKKTIIKENFSKNWDIEEELKTIQEKLRELNS